jgi:hypothetical protein
LNAALVLGYTRTSWNNGLAVLAESKGWDELEPHEKEAACCLGYDQVTWDGSSSSSSSSSSDDGDCYDEYDFDELPLKVKLAAKRLGYTKSIWDNSGNVPAEDKAWDELSTKEQEAAIVLGYTKEKWDDAPIDSNGVLVASIDNNYDDCDVDELPPMVMQAARDLGYTKVIWDADGDIPADNKDWDELNPQEQAAAQILGYTSDRWDEDNMAESGSVQSPAPVQVLRSLEARNNDNCDFMELPLSLRQAAIDLGYTQYLWDNNLHAESDSKGWDELCLEEQEAAIVFGYNKYTWDGESAEHDGDSDSTPSVAEKYYDYSFHRLPPPAVDAAEYLGYTPSTWDDDASVLAGGKAWDELSVGQQRAAQILGYSQPIWDENSDGDSSSSLSSMPSFLRSHTDESGMEFIPLQISSPSFDVDDGVKYYNWDWNDLPIPIVASAILLGYTQQVNYRFGAVFYVHLLSTTGPARTPNCCTFFLLSNSILLLLSYTTKRLGRWTKAYQPTAKCGTS